MRNDLWRRWLRLRRDRRDDLENELRFPRNDAQAGRVPILLCLSVRLLPADVRDEVLGDLIEVWRAEVSHRPWARRVLWLFRQALVGTSLMAWLFFFQNELIVRGTLADLVLGAMVPALGSVVTVALLACSAPTVRALRVEPTEAMRAEE